MTGLLNPLQSKKTKNTGEYDTLAKERGMQK